MNLINVNGSCIELNIYGLGAVKLIIMNKPFNWRTLPALVLAASYLVFAGASLEPDDPANQEGKDDFTTLGIPNDNQAEENPEISNPTITIPGCSNVVLYQDGSAYLAITMNGIWDEANEEWLKLIGTGLSGQNLWLSLDGNPKGVDIYNNSENEGNTLIADVAFLVDNSGSMSEEADEVARNIINWTKQLEAAGLDIQVGIVGYGGWYSPSIGGALNITSSDNLKEYLDRNSGIERTYGFGGPDAQELEALSKTQEYNGPDHETENGVVALRFAHDNFNFRSGANRVYVNFTDEPNQPNGNEKWSVEWVNPENNNWKPEFGTIHTVYSDYEFSSESPLWNEKPYKLSEYTGGTTMFARSDFQGVTMLDLPVTGALQNSYLIRITGIEDMIDDGQTHTITITVLTEDGAIAGVITFEVQFISAI